MSHYEVVDRGCGGLVPSCDASQKCSMGNKRHREFWRGANEQHSVIADLQLRWPVAFPKDPGAVRPLAGTITVIIAAQH